MRRIAVLAALAACGEVQEPTTTDDAGTDAAPGDDAAPADAPPAACGDGLRSAGEACYGTPVTLDGGQNAYEAQLADVDGDGDLDLVFASGAQLAYFPLVAGQFSTTSSPGPATTAVRMRARNLGGDTRLELVTGDTGAVSTWQTSGSSTAYTATSAATDTGIKPAGIELAKVTGSATPNVVASYTDKVYVGTYNGSMQLAVTSYGSVYKTSALAVGALDGDTFADIAVAGADGVFTLRGKAGSVEPVAATPYTEIANGVGIADIDGDHLGDLVFVRAGTAGVLGWMRGTGTAFTAAQTTPMPNLGGDIAIADVDGDAIDDVIVIRVRGVLAVLVFHGRADGTLHDPVELPLPLTTATSVYTGDYNQDGAPDIVVSESTTGNIVVFPSTP